MKNTMIKKAGGGCPRTHIYWGVTFASFHVVSLRQQKWAIRSSMCLAGDVGVAYVLLICRLCVA